MIQKILFLAIAFTLTACDQEQVVDDPAKNQIKEYTKKLKICEEEDGNKDYVRSLSVVSTDDIVIGDPKSKIVLVEYFAPTCPHCVHYHQKIFPEIKAKYIDNNKIAYVIREFIGNKQDLDATILARCSGHTDTYLKFLEVILNQQNNWAFSKNYREILTNIGSLGGVSPENFSTCLNDQNKIKILMENTKLVTNLPTFIGTPSFFINGEQFNEKYTFEELSKAIDKELTIDN
ncbi:MAG: protein-disulfide reductase [Alphaproteobacteria bacterium]|jgi:protein-disulfide isomerase|nr:protein-disulfide reductase [Alphaproteobacteria bacterium]